MPTRRHALHPAGLAAALAGCPDSTGTTTRTEEPTTDRTTTTDSTNTAGASDAARWTLDVGSGIERPPVVDDGTVYVSADDGTLYALAADSDERCWRTSVGVDGLPSPVVTDETVYTTGDEVYALDPDTGEPRRSFETSRTYPRLAASESGVYVAADEEVVALAPDAAERLRYRSGAPLTRPVVGADGVYVGD